MPTTFPATKREGRAKRSDETAAQPGHYCDSKGAPTFGLLDARGPSFGALVASCGFLSTLLVVAVILGQPRRADQAASETIVTPLWLPSKPLPADSGSNAAQPPKRAEPIDPPASSLPLDQPAQVSTGPEPPPASHTSQLSVLPLPAGDAFSRALKLVPVASAADQAAIAKPNPSSDLLGAVPLSQLLEHQAALAASLAVLSPDERQALPQVSIRVDAEWLEALPQTQEKLYFSIAPPRPDSLVLAYSPVARTFALERPLRPLWQIRDAQQVPALRTLRATAARRLGISAELLGLYTWHPPALESALRMFVATRIKQTGAQLGSHDVVTVRLASGADGFVMNLEPIRPSGPH